MLIRKYYEADNGSTSPVPAVVHVATEIPSLAVGGASEAVEMPHAAIHETLKGLTTATEALTMAANRIADTAQKGAEVVTPVIEEPIQASSEEIVPEITTPAKRVIRRNGRKVKRG